MRLLLISLLVVISSLAEARLPDLIPYRKGNLWGYSDSTKKIIIDTVYQHAEFFQFGKAVVKKGKKFGAIDANGKTIVPFIYMALDAGLVSGYWTANLFGSSRGIIDSTSKFTVPALYEQIYWCGGNFVAGHKNLETTIMTVTGSTVYTFKCLPVDWPPVFVNEASGFIIASNGKHGFVDMNGRIRIPLKYDQLYLNRCGYFIGKTEEKTEAFRLNGRHKRKVPVKCMQIEESIRATQFVPGCIPTEIRDGDTIPNNCGWKKADGVSWAMLPKYQMTTHFSYGMAGFMQHGLWGLVDTSFRVIIEPKYQVLNPVNEQFAMALNRPFFNFKKDPKYVYFLGYVDIHGTEYWED